MMGRQMPVHDVISPLTVLREQLQKMLIVNQCNRRCLSSIISFALYQALLHFKEVLGIHKKERFRNPSHVIEFLPKRGEGEKVPIVYYPTLLL